MSTYLIVKSDTNYTYTAKDNIDNNNKPYINISNKYFPLTTETSGTGIKVKINNNIYKIIESYTTTINTTYKSDYTIKQTGLASLSIFFHPSQIAISHISYAVYATNNRVNRVFKLAHTFSSTQATIPGGSATTTSMVIYQAKSTNNYYDTWLYTLYGTTNDSVTYFSRVKTIKAIKQFADSFSGNDTIASTVNSTRQGNTTTTTTSQ